MSVDDLSSRPIRSSETLQQSMVAIAWCLAWGTQLEPRHPDKIESWRKALTADQTPTDDEWQRAMAQAQSLTELSKAPSLSEITDLAARYPVLGDRAIGLIYGGVTKVKSYVFESADLPEIRGASALLDRINLVDLPALFNTNRDNTAKESILSKALIPQLIVYATGGNILAFCPPAFIDSLCDAIEKRYTLETLTANSCAVGNCFRPLEIYCGRLKDAVEKTLWHEAIAAKHKNNPALQAYFGFERTDSDCAIKQAFYTRKNFGELVGQLTNQFIQRRSGTDSPTATRASRRYPPMFETHPYLVRDNSDIRSSVKKITDLPDAPNLSEATARKRRIGQIMKRDEAGGNWYRKFGFEAHWPLDNSDGEGKAIAFRSWVSEFEDFLKKSDRTREYDKAGRLLNDQGNFRAEYRYKREARSLHEIGDRSNGYVAYIYADGNSMGRYIREQITTPAGYRQFSEDIFSATRDSVYEAIIKHLSPHNYTPDAKSSRQPDKTAKKEKKDSVWIHPFEIITIGGDDVLLVVPANKALEIAATIGTAFEEILLATGRYNLSGPDKPIDLKQQHRYHPADATPSRCQLSTSMGVLITAVNTPIYYAENLVSQLLKSAKKQLKKLNNNGYHSGTVDVLVLKTVTMITSNVEEFRQEGLTIPPPKPDPHRDSNLPPQREHTLKLYASPYTLHELQGLVETVKAIKRARFPKSQLYQLRGLLARGKRTAMLNYRYFRVRLEDNARKLLENSFEAAWCKAETNQGNLAPWQTTIKIKGEAEKSTTYETIWRELVELEPFIEVEEALSLPASESEKPVRGLS